MVSELVSVLGDSNKYSIGVFGEKFVYRVNVVSVANGCDFRVVHGVGLVDCFLAGFVTCGMGGFWLDGFSCWIPVSARINADTYSEKSISSSRALRVDSS